MSIMEQQILFKELKMYYLSKLDKLITVIDKVHRNLNPEIHDVKRILDYHQYETKNIER